jgi:acyl-CoA synthetase (AMP-forming)/AMP-acid ligase II
MIIAELVRRAFADHGPKLAIVHGDRRWTYDEVADRSFRLVNALRDRGIEVGDRVATLAHNDATTLELMLGLALGGYNRTALHGMGTGDTHRQVLDAAGARVLVTTAEFYDRFRAELASVESLELIIVQGAPDDSVLDYEAMLAAADPTDALVPVAGDDIVHLAFSSGSSGLPRASVHTQHSWSIVTADHAMLLPRITSSDVYLAAAPLTHAASTVLYLLVGRGASIRILDHFDAREALQLIESELCTITFVVPTMLQALADHPDAASFDLSSLRAIVYASAPISVATARRAQGVFGDVLFQTYGQSECLPVTCLTPEDHAKGAAGDDRILQSAGRVCLNARVRIEGEDGSTLPTGSVGEILISTEGRMRGIYGDEAATAQRITADGFVRSNDIGFLDEEGFLFVVDRKDDMIISGGFNIWPAEIENALLKHPAVADAAVVGVPHPKWGETPHAVVVLRSGETVSEAHLAQELMELCRTEIGSMKKPTDIVFRTDALPRNELGKLPRRVLREAYWPQGDLERQVSGA